LGRLYHPAMYQFDAPATSAWRELAPVAPRLDPLCGDASCDVAVIGGGYTGLSAALHLARDHSLQVRVLEAGDAGWGASGRNGGFCCLYPSSLSLAQLCQRYGVEAAREFLDAQLQAIDLVEEIADREQIELQRQGNGIHEVAHLPARLDELADYGQRLRSVFGIASRLIGRNEFAATVHQSSEQFGALHVQAGFGLNPLALAQGLAHAAMRHGAICHRRSEVIEWRREADGRHRLVCADGSVVCKRVIVATNGYTPEGLVPGLRGRLMPVVSNIITTRPLDATERAAQGWQTESPCSNTRHLLFYYRLLPDRRLLFGARGDTTGKPADARRMRAWMTRRLGEVFTAWRDVPVTHYWRGFVCMTRDGTPALGALDEEASVFYGLAFHGNGVAAAPWTGRMLARLAAGAATLDDVPRVMRGPAPRIPLASLRLWYLRAALACFRWSDRR
jgi:glycine/D-amino acid oxidase-like deaminating enzyme